MVFETVLTVPTPHVRELTARLAKAGFLVLDTGDRVSTDDALDGEAVLRIAHVTMADVEGPCELGVSA